MHLLQINNLVLGVFLPYQDFTLECNGRGWKAARTVQCQKQTQINKMSKKEESIDGNQQQNQAFMHTFCINLTRR